MSKARELAELGAAYDSGALSNRNMMYNGAFEVAQRSTSAVTVSDGSNEGYATVDRFKIDFGSAMGGALSAEQASSPSGNSEFGKSLKLSCTTVNSGAMGSGSTRFLSVAQYLEGLDLQHLGYGKTDAKDLTFSFWVYTNKTGRYGFSIIAQDSSSAFDVWGSFFNVTVANTWQKVTFTVEGNTAADIKVTNSYGFLIDIYLAVAANRAGISDSQWQTYGTARVPGAYTDYVDFLDNTSNVFYVTGCQLEVGTEATPFEHRSFGQELALCHRYYAEAGIVLSDSSPSRYYNTIHLPVEMRSKPTTAVGAYDVGTGGLLTAQFDNSNAANSKRCFYQGANHSTISSAWFAFDAEL